MKVAPEQPFQLIYSLFEHEYLGFIFESFVVQLDAKGQLTFSHQNISSKNAKEFHTGLDEDDYQLIKIMDSMQQDKIVQHFTKKKINTNQFFLKTYDPKVGDKVVQDEIQQYLERRRTEILPLLSGKHLFEMGSDGEPAWRRIEVVDDKATVLFHFRKNEDNTHYFPTIKLRGEKVEFRHNGSYIVGNEPAWMVVNNQLFTFNKPISGGKLKPFLQKKFILIPQNVEDTYFKKFVSPLVASFDVYAQGFDIKTEKYVPKPILTFSEVQETVSNATLFDTNSKEETSNQQKLLVELCIAYGEHQFKADQLKEVSVSLEKENNNYTFHRIRRELDHEKKLLKILHDTGLPIKNARITLPKTSAFSWLNEHRNTLESLDFEIRQNQIGGKVYFLGESSIEVKIEEGIDWFDIKAVVKFGEFEIPFKTIRNLILQKRNEIKLPNGEIGVIPDSWIAKYADLLAFSNSDQDDLRLEKHHLALVQQLNEENAAAVSMSRKLQGLLDFDTIEQRPTPTAFKGKLRPYQQAGFNWLMFLNDFAFGGCLADDMGLGKTVQTLALLQETCNQNEGSTSLLIMPTSLIYNWEMEAKRFTPKLKILNYTGSSRNKDHKNFANYDIVITSYGITRIDVEILKEFYFNYLILDESQAIKNPESIIAQSVKELRSRRKLILTGTPIENSTMDLWSQLSFANPGLLGSKSYFRNEYQLPIEKKSDSGKTARLNALIKPFILRREKSQVATDLPEKMINIKYCDLSESQREIYEKEKNLYRNKILDLIEVDGLKSSQFLLLQGLTRLRQIANHPLMVDETYKGDSGKFEDISYMIENGLNNHHNILIFSQFVKHLKLVGDYLNGQNIPYAYLDGGVKDRKGEVLKFQENKDINVFLISLKAGGLGLNLTKADYVFLLDPWWNPAIEAQAIDRAHRIGQKNKVFTYKFISRDTVEEKILVLQQSKMKLAQDLITIEESFVKSLTKDDISKLFD